MNDEDIQASLYNYVAQHYANTLDFGKPEAFDNTKVNQWTYIEIQEATAETRRKDNTNEFKRCTSLVISATCYYSGTTNLYGGVKEARLIRDVLEHAEIPVYEYSAGVSDPEHIGQIRVKEGKIINASTQENDNNVQVYVVTFDAMAESF